MNKRGIATLKTPLGEVGPIKVDQIVRQGTIMGPKLCCINTDQINKIGRKCINTIGPNLQIETLIYVDDIQNSSSNIEGLRKAVTNLQLMEEQKGYTFNVDTNKTAILITNKKKKTYNIDNIHVKLGKIELTTEYKYLGEWYNEKGNHSTTIGKRKEKVNYYINQIKYYGNEYKIGKYAMITRIKIYKSVIIPTIFYNIETWSKITKTELKELEALQEKIIKAICEQYKTTPYLGILAETGIWPLEQQLEYKQIILLHNILTSPSGRLITEIVQEQIKNPWKGCWMESVTKTCQKYNIIITEVPTMTKREIKKKVKEKIKCEVNRIIEEEINEKTKLRFIKEFGLNPYLEELELYESKIIMKIRLNMIETKCNYKGNYKNNLLCELCKKENDTTEHIFSCEAIAQKIHFRVEDIQKPTKQLAKYVKDIIEHRKKLGFEITFGE